MERVLSTLVSFVFSWPSTVFRLPSYLSSDPPFERRGSCCTREEERKSRRPRCRRAFFFVLVRKTGNGWERRWRPSYEDKEGNPRTCTYTEQTGTYLCSVEDLDTSRTDIYLAIYRSPSPTISTTSVPQLAFVERPHYSPLPATVAEAKNTKQLLLLISSVLLDCYR